MISRCSIYEHILCFILSLFSSFTPLLPQLILLAAWLQLKRNKCRLFDLLNITLSAFILGQGTTFLRFPVIWTFLCYLLHPFLLLLHFCLKFFWLCPRVFLLAYSFPDVQPKETQFSTVVCRKCLWKIDKKKNGGWKMRNTQMYFPYLPSDFDLSPVKSYQPFFERVGWPSCSSHGNAFIIFLAIMCLITLDFEC